MAHPTATQRSEVLKGFLREASDRLGVSGGNLETAVRAAQSFSNEELKVVQRLLGFVDAGESAQRRGAFSRGIVKALDAVAIRSSNDPLAVVDDPLSMVEAAEALSWAEIEAQEMRGAILKDSVSAAKAAQSTGRSRQALERLRRANRLLALRVGNQWRYPRWQFDADAPGGILPGLSDVMGYLHLSPAGVAYWLLRPSERLGGATPLELLRQRQAEPVLEQAREEAWMP